MKNKTSHSTSFSRKRESSSIEKKWLDLAKQRLDDITNKRVETISSHDVFQRIEQRLNNQRLNK